MDFSSAYRPQQARNGHLRARAMKNLFMAVSLGLCTTANAQDIDTLEQDLAHEVGAVDLRSGITRAQAGTIAEHYCRRYIGGCGTVAPATDRHSDWAVVPLTDPAGVADKNAILVGKHTGRISWGKGPTLNLPDLVGPKESAPRPIRRSGANVEHSYGPKVKVQFSVLPNGTVANARFKQSSSDPKCDQRGRRIVEAWRFPARERPIELITALSCAR
ncbi:TonB family protein [Lysobacter enzymogenes]|uniref:TonB family protein n=1 Tax=Lysobacter enzymogenes TaxID=69 RepID=UPI00339163BF